jgi:hypothetical protein
MANRFWVGGAGTWDDSSTTHWSATSGGAAGASAPTQSDDVTFDQATTYTVTCNNGFCRNITVSAGTVTFNVTSNGGAYFFCYGNISISAATSFTALTNGYGNIIHTPLAAAGCTVSFGSSGTNTQKAQFLATQNYGAWGATSYTFCTAATQTFAGVFMIATGIPFTCAGSTITVDWPDRAGNTTDGFYINGFSSASVAATTVNMGTAIATTLPQAADFGFIISGATVEPAITTFNVIQVRAYSGTTWSSSWGSSALPLKFGNLTFKGNLSSGPYAYLNGVYGSNAFTGTDYQQISINGGSTKNKVFSGAFTLNGVSTCILDAPLSTTTFSSTTTLTTGTGSTNGSVLNLYNFNSGKNTTFTGAVSMTGGSSFGSSLVLQTGATITLSSTLSSTAPNGLQNNIEYGSGSTISIAGNTALTNTNVSATGLNWVQTGATTFIANTSPTSSSYFFSVYSFTSGTGQIDFQSTNVTLSNSSGSNALSAGGKVVVTGFSTSTGVTFTAAGPTAFVAATLATWTDVAVSISNSFTVTGAGGFTLAGATKNSSFTAGGAFAVTGNTQLYTAPNYNITVDSVTAGGAAFDVIGTSGTTGIFTISGSSVGTSQFSNTFAVTNMGFSASCTTLTFSSSLTLTNPNRINVNGTTTTISSNLSISSTNLIDGISGAFGNFYFNGDTLTTSSTSATWTFTNARIYFQFSNAGTITNPVTLADNGGLYWAASNLTLNSALTSSGASKWNILLLKTYGATLTLKGAVTLVNCQLAATNIVVDGGATKNFAYSLSTPICNNTTVNSTEYYGNSRAQNYPEICVDSFTVSSGGATFSITGGGSAIYRTLIRPYRASAADPTTSSCVLSLPSAFTSFTLQDVDFWRVTNVTGTITKPLTGTRLGNVGTITTNITPTTPKSVYWVGGAGAWSDAKWALTSGGTGSAANYPLPQDTVTFNASSGTGAITYPASVRVGNLFVDDVPAGTTSVYCNSTNSTTYPSYLWVSKSINGPAGTPTGTFILGNTSSFTYNSFAVGSGTQLQTTLIADSSASDTHTINPININFMSYGSMQFATLGTTTISGSITAPLYNISDYCTDAYTINITAAQIGSTSFNYGDFNYASSSLFSLGKTFLGGTGTINYGACSIYIVNFYVSSLTSNTAYTVNVWGNLYALGATQVGNANLVGNPSITASGWNVYVDTAVSFLSLNVIDYGSSGTSYIYINPSSSIIISMYAFTVTYNGSATGMLLYGSGQTFTKLGGGSVGVTGVNVTSIDASPANTWYTTGTVTSSTGWNSGSAPNSKGGFLLFQ